MLQLYVLSEYLNRIKENEWGKNDNVFSKKSKNSLNRYRLLRWRLEKLYLFF